MFGLYQCEGGSGPSHLPLIKLIQFKQQKKVGVGLGLYKIVKYNQYNPDMITIL